MDKEQQQIKEFMIKAGQDCPEKPCIPSFEVGELRLALMREELQELQEAIIDMPIPDSLEYKELSPEKRITLLAEVYDAILDLLVVTIGTAVACGLRIEPGWQEVHRSNMTKFIDGHRREDGKWVKGPSFSPPELASIIKQQSESSS